MLKTIIILSLSALLILISAIALAQSSGGDFEIVKSTVDNGGGTSVGGEFSLTGTIGQHDASRQSSAGDEYLLAGGFWAKTSDIIFSDGFESN